MNREYLFKFASKNLSTHKLRAMLTITGMVIGISAIIFLVSFAFGVENLVTKEITSGNAYELIDVGTGNSQIVKLTDDTINRIREIGGVENALTVTNLAAKLKKSSDTSTDISLFGTSPEYMEWSGENIRWGQPLSQEDTAVNQAIISDSLLNFLELSEAQEALGKNIQVDIIVPEELSKNRESKVYENNMFNIVGITSAESPAVYVLNSSLSGLELQNYSQAKVKVSSAEQIDKVRKQIENMGLKTEYVGETVSQIKQVFSFFEIILGSFGLIALIVASLAMFNTLTISLLERTKEVALLKILGMKKKSIESLFLIEAIIMSAIGGLIGILVGIAFSSIANSIVNSIAQRSGGEAVQIFAHPYWFILAVMFFSIIVGFLTGIYPAKRATRINALDVMRYE